jgi:hypothetical protein
MILTQYRDKNSVYRNQGEASLARDCTLEHFTPRDMPWSNLRAKKSASCSLPVLWRGTSKLGPRQRKQVSETRERQDLVSAFGPDIAHASCTYICPRISLYI